MDKDLFEFALASMFCTSPDERVAFSGVFKKYWREKGTRIRDQSDYKNQKKSNKSLKKVAVMMGRSEGSESSENDEELELPLALMQQPLPRNQIFPNSQKGKVIY